LRNCYAKNSDAPSRYEASKVTRIADLAAPFHAGGDLYRMRIRGLNIFGKKPLPEAQMKSGFPSENAATQNARRFPSLSNVKPLRRANRMSNSEHPNASESPNQFPASLPGACL
jgi:hypothetical protein